MRDSLEKRVPTTDLNLCAAILDTSMRNLAIIQTSLEQRNISGGQFLIQMYNKYVKDESPAAASLTSQPSDTEVIEPWKKI